MEVIKKYPTLYKLSSNGKITQWNIKVIKEGDKYYIQTENGYTDGKKIPHKREIKRGKAKRTKEEQAISEADSKFRAKTERDVYREEMPSKDKKAVNKGKNKLEKRIYELGYPFIRPMLAQKIEFSKKDCIFTKNIKKVKFPALIQPKLDGLRCLVHIQKGKIQMRTRNNLEYSFMDHIKEDLQKMYKALKKLRKDWDFTYFDGEIYNPDIPFEEISGKSRIKKPKEADLKIISSLKLYLFDMFTLKDLDEPFSKRYALLHHLFQLVKPKHLVLVKNQIINKPKDICSIFDKYMSEGYEGIMVRNQKASYKIDKRSYDLLKYKSFEDDEFEIIGFKQGSGSQKGAIIFILKTKEGKEFSAVPNGTIASGRKMFKEGDKYIGKMLTVEYQELSQDGIPRFPKGKAIRFDK